MGSDNPKTEWIPCNRREPVIVRDRLKAFCNAGPTRLMEEEQAAAVYLWPALPAPLQDLVRQCVFGDEAAQAELEAKMGVFRDGWPSWTANGAA